MNDLFCMVEIEINSNCNRACSYCPNSKLRRKEKGQMDPNIFNQILLQLEKINYTGRISYHFYGEPLLCSELVNYVSLTKQRLPLTRRVLYSNGDLLNREKVHMLVDAGIDKMVITRHEGPKHSFDQTYQALQDDIVEKIDYLHYADLHLTNRGGTMIGVGKSVPESFVCYVPHSLIVITVFGNVLPCFEDYKQKLVMGNICDENLMDIWNSEKYINFRNKLANGDRSDFPICSVCNNDSVQDNGQFDYVL